MESHKCKLCSRTFINGRALGGHMKAHLATLPLPPKSEPYSSSSSSSEDEEEAVAQRESDEKGVIYGLRENPKKSLKLADPEFSLSFPTDTGSVVVQDRESETESKNPTRRRSKRTRKLSFGGFQGGHSSEQKKPTLMDSPEPVSSVSNTSPEEDVAMCLIMLSRDKWNINAVVEEEVERSMVKSKGIEEIEFKRVRGKHKCDNCGKTFRSSRALGSHKSICLLFCNNIEAGHDQKIFQCPFCCKVFGSGQALGGHKRSHLYPSSSSMMKENVPFIDLNLPAPGEDDDPSVLSDA